MGKAVGARTPQTMPVSRYATRRARQKSPARSVRPPEGTSLESGTNFGTELSAGQVTVRRLFIQPSSFSREDDPTNTASARDGSSVAEGQRLMPPAGFEPATVGLEVQPEGVQRDGSGLLGQITSKEFG
jgi:hypothetical protein